LDLQIGSLTIHGYGLLTGIGALAAFRTVGWTSARLGLNPTQLTQFFTCVCLGGIIGAKLLLFALNYERYSQNPLELLTAGGVFYGGLIAGTAAGYLLVRHFKLNAWRVADAVLPAVALGQVFGRLGCFAGGCCYGKPTHSDWGVSVADSGSLALRHPTPIYESVAVFALWLVLIHLVRRRAAVGQVALAYALGYAALRFVIEFFRGDAVRGFVLGGLLSTSQFIAAAIAISAAIAIWRRHASSIVPLARVSG
jgi:phosphatidylglycerol:prolipoprotein diacylglycerol transferase